MVKFLKIIGIGLLFFLVLAALLIAAALKPLPAREALGTAQLTQNNNKHIEYYRSGEGPTLVLLPSFARTASDFNELATALNAAGYRTLAIEPGGAGNSDWPGMSVKLDFYAHAIKKVLQVEQLDQAVVLIGHAFGNRIARSFASVYPEQTHALVLLAAGGREPTPLDVSKAIQTTLFGFSNSKRASAVQNAFFAADNIAPDYWINGWYPLAGLAQANATATTAFEQWGNAGTSPMLVLQALQDKAAPASSSGRKLLADFPDRVDYREVDNAGHAFLPEQHDWIVENILDYLRGIEY